MNDSCPPQPVRRWYHLTPDRLLIALLPVLGLLLVSEWFRWFPFNEHKGWTVLIALHQGWTVLIALAVVCLAAVVLRRRFEFGLSSLFLLIVVVAIPCSWLAVKMQRARRQREPVEAIQKAGGRVGYDWGNVKPKSSAPVWLRRLVGEDFFADVYSVSLKDTGVGDKDLEHLTGTPHLYMLVLSGTQITDAGLQHLKGMKNLWWLYLSDTQVTDGGLEYLKGMTSLQQLYLSGTQITDAGLERLTGLIDLAVLDVSDTQVTGTGLEYLKGMIAFQLLDLSGTQVTDAGLTPRWVGQDGRELVAGADQLGEIGYDARALCRSHIVDTGVRVDVRRLHSTSPCSVSIHV